MSGRLNGKQIVVTAAGQGIGKATAIAFSKEGANVFATDINQETLNILKKENPKIDIFKLDSTDKASVENYFKHMNQITHFMCENVSTYVSTYYADSKAFSDLAHQGFSDFAHTFALRGRPLSVGGSGDYLVRHTHMYRVRHAIQS